MISCDLWSSVGVGGVPAKVNPMPKLMLGMRHARVINIF